MTYFNIYIINQLELDELADLLRRILNCNTKNQTTGQVDQKRYGANFGGHYYLFEIMGLELRLLKNEGEVFESHFAEYDYYINCIELEEVDANLFKECIGYLGQLLRTKGIENKVIEM